LSGQLALKNVRSPNLFPGICNPSAGMPRYRTVNCLRSPALSGDGSVITKRSARCTYGTGAPPDVTSDTVMPLPLAADARSSANSVTPSATNRRSTVVSPMISSLSSLSVTRKT
jgi:hypothetical protein